MGGKRALDHLNDRGFRFAVSLGQQIDRVGLAHNVDAAQPLEMNSASRAGRTQRDIFDFVGHGPTTIGQLRYSLKARGAHQSTDRQSANFFDRSSSTSAASHPDRSP